MKKTDWLFAALLPFLYLGIHQGRLSAQSPAAVVLEVKGKCEIFKDNKPARIKKGMYLFENDSVVISKKGAVLILDSLDRFVQLDRSGKFVLTRETGESGSRRFFREWVAARTWFDKSRNKKWDALRSGGDNMILLDSPRNTKLRQVPQTLSWSAKKLPESLEISVRCYDNDYAFKKEIRGSQFSAAGELDVEPGPQYFWTVQDAKADISSAPAVVWFSVMSAGEAAALEQETQLLKAIMRSDTVSVAYQLLYAGLLQRYGLLEECRAVLDAVLASEPDHPVALMFYARLMEQMDLPEQTKRYIELTDKYER